MTKRTLDDVSEQLEKLGKGGLMDAIELVAIDYGLQAETQTKKLMTTVLKVRTGRLRNSVRQRVKRTKTKVIVTLQAGGKRVPYMMVHEFGSDGDITPKKGKYLRLPLPPAKTKAGVDRRSGGSLRGDKDFRFVTAKYLKGNNPLLIHVPSGKPWYVLKKSVRIPPRPTISKAYQWLEANMIPALEDAIKFELEG